MQKLNLTLRESRKSFAPPPVIYDSMTLLGTFGALIAFTALAACGILLLLEVVK